MDLSKLKIELEESVADLENMRIKLRDLREFHSRISLEVGLSDAFVIYRNPKDINLLQEDEKTLDELILEKNKALRCVQSEISKVQRLKSSKQRILTYNKSSEYCHNSISLSDYQAYLAKNNFITIDKSILCNKSQLSEVNRRLETLENKLMQKKAERDNLKLQTPSISSQKDKDSTRHILLVFILILLILFLA